MIETAIIVILYNPQDSISKYWNNLIYKLPLNFTIYLMDNSSTENPIFRGYINYKYFKGNKGIAYAQNYGIKKAIKDKCTYIYFSDQDSKINITDIIRLKTQFIDLHNTDNLIAAIGPRIINIDNHKNYKGESLTYTQPFLVNTIISSGTLSSISVFKIVGLFNERLFIDLVDHEWCWRANAKGYKIYKSHNVSILHKVGSRSFSFLGFQFIISAPIRYYYQYRNTIWLFKSTYADITWKRKIIFRKFIEAFIIPFYTTNPLLTLKYITKGIRDGFLKNQINE